MNKPRWEKLHDWWKEDFKFFKEQKQFFAMLVRKRPGDKLILDTIKNIDKRIYEHQKEYKKIYGVRFNLRQV